MPKKTVVIVENERALGKFLRERLELGGSDYEVFRTGSLEETLEIVRNKPVHLIVAEHQGPRGIDGLVLLRNLRDLDCPVQVVLTAEAELEQDRIEALTLGCVCFLVKPYSMEQMYDVVQKSLQRQQGFSGRLVGMKLEDVIEMLCFRRESTLVSVTNGRTRGTIYVGDGGILHAHCDDLTGVEAFYEIVGWERGEFVSQTVTSVPERTVFFDWQSLLMEGVRQKDEIRHALTPGPSSKIPGLPQVQGAAAGPEAGHHAAAASAKRIMIVDDSRLIRKIVHEILQSEPDIDVVGYAINGQEALAKLDSLKPDLVLLDWDMPVMKGSTTLMHMMIRSPCPVVILSGFVGGVGANPFDLLCLGAVDFLRKPQSKWRSDGRADDMVNRIKEACGIKLERIRRVKVPSVVKKDETPLHPERSTGFVSVLVSGTGGCADLIRIIPSLKPDLKSGLIVLHDMQQEAISAFVDYLDRRSQVPVRLVGSDMLVLDGVCYVHPATVPIELVQGSEGVYLSILSEPTGSRVLDHFLVSASKVMGSSLMVVLLSGSSELGIEGLRAIKYAEGTTLVEDPRSLVDPRLVEAALQEGLADHRAAADTLGETFVKLIG
ncbi:MAG: response regulator [Thermodesulfobacteriota bacterium]